MFMLLFLHEQFIYANENIPGKKAKFDTLYCDAPYNMQEKYFVCLFYEYTHPAYNSLVIILNF